MRTLDRYLARQLFPVWLWCMVVFLFISCLVDLFGHLDEILQYRVALPVLLQYYLNFLPIIFIRSCPLAMLFGTAFVATRLARYHEVLAMNAGGISLIRMSIPFLFIGWLISLLVFFVNERIVPRTSATFERLRQETFHGHFDQIHLENIAIMDDANRLYHARVFDSSRDELTDLTILEHDEHNHPKRSLYAHQAFYTPKGWLLRYGTVTRVDAQGALIGEPQPFFERLSALPVTPDSFKQSERNPDLLRIAQLRQLIYHLKRLGITNVRHYEVELAAKLAFPLMNLVICLIGFVGATTRHRRGHLQGLGISLLWGMAYYVGVAIGHGAGKDGLLPALAAVWLPHLLATAWTVRVVWQRG